MDGSFLEELDKLDGVGDGAVFEGFGEEVLRLFDENMMMNENANRGGPPPPPQPPQAPQQVAQPCQPLAPAYDHQAQQLRLYGGSHHAPCAPRPGGHVELCDLCHAVMVHLKQRRLHAARNILSEVAHGSLEAHSCAASVFMICVVAGDPVETIGVVFGNLGVHLARWAFNNDEVLRQVEARRWAGVFEAVPGLSTSVHVASALVELFERDDGATRAVLGALDLDTMADGVAEHYLRKFSDLALRLIQFADRHLQDKEVARAVAGLFSKPGALYMHIAGSRNEYVLAVFRRVTAAARTAQPAQSAPAEEEQGEADAPLDAPARPSPIVEFVARGAAVDVAQWALSARDPSEEALWALVERLRLKD